jgi:RND family efflux transporter MFP subunit
MSARPLSMTCRLMAGGLIVVAGAMLSGAVPAAAQQAAGPLPVSVAKPVARRVVETADFTGRFQAWPSVDVTSRVTGYLEKAPFTEGALVKEGDVLFQIDARPFKAAVDQSAAQVEVAKTKLDLAKTNLDRAEELKKSGNVTDAAYQAQQQAFLESQALVNAANANLANARLDLEFSTIKAPITGKIGRKLVSPGNIVVANATSPLASIVAVDPILFYFDVDEANYLAYQRAEGDKGAREAAIALSDERDFPHKGTLDFVAPQVDAATGTVTARIVVPNKDGFLTSGLFGRVRMALTPPYEGLVLPDEAVGSSAMGNFVMAVAPDGTVGMKTVTAGPKFGSFRVVKSGLTPDDLVIVNGLMRARPGGKVIPQPVELKVPQDLSTAGTDSAAAAAPGVATKTAAAK